MANVWFCFDGPEPAYGGAHYQVSVIQCIEELDLSESQLLSGLLPPRQNSSDAWRTGAIAGYKHVVVELRPDEAAAVGWMPGYYLLPLSPRQVMKRLDSR